MHLSRKQITSCTGGSMMEYGLIPSASTNNDIIMNILWIVNIDLPEVVSLLTGCGEIKSTGGWLVGAAESLVRIDENIKLTICSVSKKVQMLTLLHGKKADYYLLPYGRGNISYNAEYEKYWKEINTSLKPDIIHIHGSEYTHGLAYVKACGNKNVVVSIQGMKSAHKDYYYADIAVGDILKNLTLLDLIKGSIIRQKNKFKISGICEKELLKNINYIIGRTSWDRARTWAINEKAEYHFCNETLRPEFYDGLKWDYSKCSKHSIFVSQAGYPIKGFHKLLSALPIILRHYPDTQVRVAGYNITKFSSWKDLQHYSGYGRFIKKMIEKLNLSDCITFIGSLNATEMKKEYLNCNVFISPSSIENSPNSVGEAQILGTPVISSYVGGVMDFFANNDRDNLYRFEETDMLAYKVSLIFDKQEQCVSEDSIEIASKRHDALTNSHRLLDIYNSILRNGK